MSNLDEILRRLIAAGVDFVVVGGFAVAAHGADLVTEALDVCAQLDFENLKKIHAALEDAHPVFRDQRRIPFELHRVTGGLNNLYLSTDLGQIDFLGSLPNYGSFQKVWDNSIMIETDVGPMRLLSIDALIEVKATIGRPRDKEAVIKLRAIKEERERDRE